MGEQQRRRWVHDHALGLLFVALWLLFWAGQTWANIAEYASDQETHHQAVTFTGLLAFWGGRTLENLQSEMFQLASFVIFSAYLLYRGSPESKDSDEETRAYLQRIEGRLRAMSQVDRQRGLQDMGVPPPSPSDATGGPVDYDG